ncbi:MAG: membrane integrity-associated transporter subunit PqiC [Desulfuromonadales bacterium]|nr:membrane integrity-associated transporter subunit PqiC [Desulfuromonadales bacterium]
MNLNACRFTFLLLVISLGSQLSGCFGTSPPTRFYTLSSPEIPTGPTQAGLDVVLRVGPLTFPEYLDRRQIVSRSGQNGIALAEFDQWSGPLEDEVTRVLVAGIAEKLASPRIAVLSGKFSGYPDTVKWYRIPVKVIRFDGFRGGTVALSVVWGIIEKRDMHEKHLFTRESTITEAVAGNSYEALVAAMGRAAGKLAREMADHLAALIPK